MIGWIIVLIIIALIVIYLIAIYNGLVTSRNAYKNAFAQIDVQLTRRHDLIPNLVETVKGYAAHEKGTLEAVTQARANAINAQGLELTGTLTAPDSVAAAVSFGECSSMKCSFAHTSRIARSAVVCTSKISLRSGRRRSR